MIDEIIEFFGFDPDDVPRWLRTTMVAVIFVIVTGLIIKGLFGDEIAAFLGRHP